MTASRRVRLTRYVHEQVGRIPAPQRIALIEYPRVTSRRDGRPDEWEWRLARAVVSPARIVYAIGAGRDLP